jgi:hypothetical protein
MSKRSRNALTHGGYVKEVLPWEDGKAFDKLHEDLRRDLKPSGFLQEQTVREIAVEYWRKQRVAIAHALPFYKKQITPELMEAAKSGIAGLAAYLADPTHRGTMEIASEDLLAWHKKNMAARMAIPPEDDSNEPDEPATKKPNPITAEIVEQAYDLATYEKHLKIETMIDNRIKSHMGRFFALKAHAQMCGEKLIESLPPPQATPVDPPNAPCHLGANIFDCAAATGPASGDVK